MASIRRGIGHTTYRNERGQFVSKAQVEAYYQDTGLREAIYQQRIQASHVEHLLREDYPILHRAPEYNRERDQRLREFAETPREDRTREEWRQWEEDMTAIYGDDRDDWGDYA